MHDSGRCPLSIFCARGTPPYAKVHGVARYLHQLPRCLCRCRVSRKRTSLGFHCRPMPRGLRGVLGEGVFVWVTYPCIVHDFARYLYQLPRCLFRYGVQGSRSRVRPRQRTWMMRARARKTKRARVQGNCNFKPFKFTILTSMGCSTKTKSDPVTVEVT